MPVWAVVLGVLSASGAAAFGAGSARVSNLSTGSLFVTVNETLEMEIPAGKEAEFFCDDFSYDDGITAHAFDLESPARNLSLVYDGTTFAHGLRQRSDIDLRAVEWFLAAGCGIMLGQLLFSMVKFN